MSDKPSNSNQVEWSKNFDLKSKAELYPLKLYRAKELENKAWEHLSKMKNKKQYLLNLILKDMEENQNAE